MKLSPGTPLRDVEWIPGNRTPNLARLGLATLGDLLRHFPRRHEDRRRFAAFPREENAQPVLLHGVVVKTAYLPFGRWRRGFEAILEDADSGAFADRITCRWFNLPFVCKTVATGMELVVFGRPKLKGKRVVIDQPEFEAIESKVDAGLHLGRIVPVHRGGEGISPRKLREWIFKAIECTDFDEIDSLIPRKEGAGGLGPALRNIHFPDEIETIERARQRLALEEFFGLQLIVAARRRALRKGAGMPKQIDGHLLRSFLASLPFRPTDAQKRAIKQIRADMASPHRMNRLLQGDVGSGKTLVALAAALLAVEAGWDAVLMAPTQILAEQHFANFSRLLSPLGISLALRTGVRREEGGALPLWAEAQCRTGAASLAGEHPVSAGAWNDPARFHPVARIGRIFVGTHALLFGDDLRDFGLVIIDEQHKFGVIQRWQLVSRCSAADVLIMTATPIPRTLAQTVYGDLDVTVIDEMPSGRQATTTAVRNTKKLPDIADFVRTKLREGRQAYVVYPLIEESEKLEAKAATEEFERWREWLRPHRCALMHGRIPADEREGVMREFRNGSIHALVSTTVIEVGVDIPNATVMVIENAERFGLAQLHQLRGRIGRGAHKSYCFLVPGTADQSALDRLAILERTANGFEIAEEDLILRGPGDILGTAQTGLPPLSLGDIVRDGSIIAAARSMAQRLLHADSDLALPEHGAIRAFVDRHQRSIVDRFA